MYLNQNILVIDKNLAVISMLLLLYQGKLEKITTTKTKSLHIT
jgi:hypothetical protein